MQTFPGSIGLGSGLGLRLGEQTASTLFSGSLGSGLGRITVRQTNCEHAIFREPSKSRACMYGNRTSCLLAENALVQI